MHLFGERLGVAQGRRIERGGWIGSCTISVTSAGSVRSRPFRHHGRRVPMIATGTIGSPASIASRKLPALNRATCPSGLRVPSAKMISDSPSDTSARQRRRMPARSGCRRSTNRCPPAPQVPAEHRKPRQRLLGDDPQLVRQRREDHRRVVDALMIRDEHVGRAGRDRARALRPRRARRSSPGSATTMRARTGARSSRADRTGSRRSTPRRGRWCRCVIAGIRIEDRPPPVIRRDAQNLELQWKLGIQEFGSSATHSINRPHCEFQIAKS